MKTRNESKPTLTLQLNLCKTKSKTKYPAKVTKFTSKHYLFGKVRGSKGKTQKQIKSLQHQTCPTCPEEKHKYFSLFAKIHQSLPSIITSLNYKLSRSFYPGLLFVSKNVTLQKFRKLKETLNSYGITPKLYFAGIFNWFLLNPHMTKLDATRHCAPL